MYEPGKLVRGCVLILAATIVALVLRLPRLGQRPMHGDEAVHAIKFGQLLEAGAYTYDPNEYHGPTLNYLTLIPARLASATKLTQVTEFILRIVPVFFGVCLVLLLLLTADGLGPRAAVCAAVLTAISPAMVFYSRYYIHETLLVCFTFGAIACAYRYTQSTNLLWAISTGIFLGLMHATKETCIIAFGSMFLALLLVLLIRRLEPGDDGRSKRDASIINRLSSIHLIAGLAAAAIVSALFYSSFLTNPRGILDSFRAYGVYFGRAGSNTLHIHPWYYYLKMLMYSRYSDGPIWTEGLIVLLAAVGFVAAMRRKGLQDVRHKIQDTRNETQDTGLESGVWSLKSGVNVHLLRFIAFYTLVMTVVYSAIPYKTPWCMLGFLHGMILLAGVGAVTLVKWVPNVLPRLIVICLLIVACLHLALQAYLSSYEFYADSRNPYVYAHPTAEVFTIVQRVEDVARVHKDGKQMQIQVICPEDDYWPLPWYLRSFSKVQWQNEVPDDAPSVPLIIASDKVQEALTNKLYVLTPIQERKMYLFLFDKPYYVWLRPKVKLMGFVRKDLWDRYQQHQAESVQSQKTPEK